MRIVSQEHFTSVSDCHKQTSSSDSARIWAYVWRPWEWIRGQITEVLLGWVFCTTRNSCQYLVVTERKLETFGMIFAAFFRLVLN